MKIYTKSGDDGTTALFGGARVPKYDLRIESYGTVDELNSIIGAVLAQPESTPHNVFLQDVQEHLFLLGANLATQPDKKNISLPQLTTDDVATIENEIDRLEASLPPLKNFILPGGSMPAALAHMARCVCRRAERLCTNLASREKVDPLVLVFLNRLSDYLFVLARTLNFKSGNHEIPWLPRKK
jgi:cob(I)alamin adenosyltransferase